MFIILALDIYSTVQKSFIFKQKDKSMV